MHLSRIVPNSLFCGLALVALTGCQRQDPTSEVIAKAPTASPVAIREGIVPDEETKNRFLAAKEDLFQQLSSRLMSAMNTGGPAEAIEVCHSQAPKIASEVSKTHNLKIGRSGVRLRNQSNQPPDWAKPLVEAKTETPTFGVLTTDQAVALLPIKLQPQCLMCHGPKEQLSDDVIRMLSQRYPKDQATGFQVGELRGWFWIEDL